MNLIQSVATVVRKYLYSSRLLYPILSIMIFNGRNKFLLIIITTTTTTTIIIYVWMARFVTKEKYNNITNRKWGESIDELHAAFPTFFLSTGNDSQQKSNRRANKLANAINATARGAIASA